MNNTNWSTLREYIDAEIKLAFARYDLVGMQMLGVAVDVQDNQRAKIATLEEASTAHETAIRKSCS